MQARDNVVDLKAFAGLSLPPQNTDIEEALLGAILIDRNAIARVVDILQPQAFYYPAHRAIYEAACDLHRNGAPVDLMTVEARLIDSENLNKAGGTQKLGNLAGGCVSSVNADHYAEIIADKYQRRQLIDAGNAIVRLGHDADRELDDVFNDAEQAIFNVSAKSSFVDVEDPFDILARIYNNFDQEAELGYKTGLYDLDDLLGGLKRKRLYVVAGRTAMGKTHMGLFLAYQMLVQHGQPVVFFSAEMDRDALMRRLLAANAKVPSDRIENHQVTESEIQPILTAIAYLGQLPLYLDDTPGNLLTASRIRSGIRQATLKYGKPALVVLDYLQLLGDEGVVNRVQELDKIANACKNIAKEMDVAFVAIAQVNRGVENRQNKRPMMSDLRESGAIEQAADTIMLLYRDDYYNPGTPDRGIIEINCAKNRGSREGIVKCFFDPEYSDFRSMVSKGNFEGSSSVSHWAPQRKVQQPSYVIEEEPISEPVDLVEDIEQEPVEVVANSIPVAIALTGGMEVRVTLRNVKDEKARAVRASHEGFVGVIELAQPEQDRYTVKCVDGKTRYYTSEWLEVIDDF